MDRTRRAQLRLFSLLLAFVALAPALLLADDARRGSRRSFDGIVVFGTSLSDPGNAFAMSHNHLVAPYTSPALDPFLVPESEWPYAVGGNHFSNGRTWAEQLGRALGHADDVKPAFVDSRHGSANYAVGGSRARDGVENEVTLSQQVTEFLKDAGKHVSPRALYVIEIGVNDLRDAQTNSSAIAGALGGLGNAVARLYAAGARTFLVWNLPSLGRAPATRALDAFFHAGGAVINQATNATIFYNALLASTLNGLPAAFPGIEIIQFDAFATLETIIGDKESYGLLDVEHACIRPGTPPPSRCEDPDRYLFWDGVHPTRAGHRIIAIEVGKALGAALLPH